MNSKQLGTIGPLLLIVGVFCPLVELPIVGSVSYVGTGAGDGWIIIALAILALGSVLTNRTKALLLIGLIGLAVCGYTFSRMAKLLIEEANSMAATMSWGWGVLLAGLAATMLAGFIEVDQSDLAAARRIVNKIGIWRLSGMLLLSCGGLAALFFFTTPRRPVFIGSYYLEPQPWALGSLAVAILGVLLLFLARRSASHSIL